MSGQLRILVVDDDAAIRAAYASQLADHDIVEAVSFDQAQVTIQRDQFDLVLLDVWLGEISSLPLIAQIKQMSPSTDVVMISGASTIRTAVQALQEGARDYLEKPVSRNRLLQTVRTVMTDRRARRKIAHDKAQALQEFAILGNSSGIDEIRQQISKIAPSDLPVLIHGPTGSGKELIAQNIHWQSARSGGSLVCVNCAALAETTIEAELFGYVQGAFTGADRDRDGLLLAADDGTLFLDEIGDLPSALQPKLLRVIETGRYMPMGSTQERMVDIRWLAATHKHLHESDFRQDLYHRLAGVTINLPALNKRPEDIPLLVEHFIAAYANRVGLPAPIVEPEAIAELQQQALAGNVRELRQIIERTAVLAGSRITQFYYSPNLATDGRGNQALEPGAHYSEKEESVQQYPPMAWDHAKHTLHREFLRQRLEANEGNKTSLAAELGIHPNNLHRLLRGLDI